MRCGAPSANFLNWLKLQSKLQSDFQPMNKAANKKILQSKASSLSVTLNEYKHIADIISHIISLFLQKVRLFIPVITWSNFIMFDVSATFYLVAWCMSIISMSE